MRMRKLSVALPILVSLTLSCQPAVEDMAGSMEEDLLAIRAQTSAFQTAVRTADFPAAAEIMAEDIVVMVPNQASIVGRQAWSEWVGTWGIAEVTQYEIGIEDIHVSGDLAYVRGTFTEVLHLQGVEEPYADEGKFLQIWRKGADGMWRIAVDCWNSILPLPVPE